MNNSIDEYENENPFGLETISDFHKTRRDFTIQLIKEYIQNKVDVNVLDVGCGMGAITKLIAENFRSVNIDAIDIVEKAIQLAKKDYESINFMQADAMSFMGLEYKYDIIVLNNIYEHVENPCGMLINLKKLLKDNGVFIISTPNRYFIKNILRKIFGLRISIPKYHITEYSIGQIYDHHLYCGLKIKQIILPKFKRERFKLIDFVSYTLLQPPLDYYLKITKSKTRMGSLLFIISSK